MPSCTVLNCPELWKGHVFLTKHLGIFIFQRKCLWHQIVSNQWCNGMFYAHLKSCTVKSTCHCAATAPAPAHVPLQSWVDAAELHCFLRSSAPVENRGKGRETPRRGAWQEVIGANLRILQGKPLLPAAVVSLCPGVRSQLSAEPGDLTHGGGRGLGTWGKTWATDFHQAAKHHGSVTVLCYWECFLQ